MTDYANSHLLVETGWLEDHLGDGDLRILDCTVFLKPDPDAVYRVESGRAAYDAGHIPGARYVDLAAELSDPESSLRFAFPPADRFAGAMAGHGVGEGARVVLYSTGDMIWATRVWWMLRAFGFDEAQVLNGGFGKWRREGRPVSTAPASYPRARFAARPRSGLVAGKEDVLAAIGESGTLVINALSEEQHRGTGGVHYGRPGHITGSVNVPARSLVDPETGLFLAAPALEALFAQAGALEAPRVITYCGGGIAATGDAFALALLGREDVAVYDGSLSEWVADESLPMETG